MTRRMRNPIAIIGAASRPAVLPGDVDPFDPEFFGLSPVEAKALAPAQRAALIASWDAIESAGCPPASLARTITGVFLGAWEASGDSAADPLGITAAMAVRRICHLLDLRGPSTAIDTGDSSWLYAVHAAVHSLQRRESTLALAGGPDAGATRISMFVLKRLSEATSARDHLLAVIHDSAIDVPAGDPESFEPLAGLVGIGSTGTRTGRRTVTGGSAGASSVSVRMRVSHCGPNEVLPDAQRDELLCVSARSARGLDKQIRRYAEHLRDAADTSLAHHCYTANAGRSHFLHRAAVVAATPQLAAAQLTALESQPAGRVARDPGRRSRVAFLFSGHGSSIAAVGRSLYEGQPEFRRAFDRCDQLARRYVSHRGLTDVFTTDASAISPDLSLEHAGLFAFQWALAELWRSWGVRPDVVLGHSAGECAAACVARALSLETGLMVTATRGRVLQSLPPGAMVSISAPLRHVRDLIAPEGEQLCLAAINGPERVVVSGPPDAVRSVADRMTTAGIHHRFLRVPIAAHSPAVEPVLDELKSVISSVRAKRPGVPMISTLTGSWVTAPLDADHWCRHMRQTVRFADAATTLFAEGLETSVEIGPDDVLSTLTAECAAQAGVPIQALPSLISERDSRTQLLDTLGALYVSGVEPDWRNLYRGRKLYKVSLPTYPFQSAVRGQDTAAPATRVRIDVRSTEAIETIVRGHVCDILGLPEATLAPDDHFLSLGMDSLRIARCAAALSRSLRVACSAGDVLAHATCADLALLLYERLTTVDGGTRATHDRHRLRVLNPTGARTPLVCIHPSGGRVSAYLRLSSLLREHPVYAMESRGLSDPALEHDSIRSMAEDYAGVLVRDGLDSVALLGWSMGGLVAHAVCEALEAQGRSVAFVGLIDPRTPEFSGTGGDARFARRALAHEPDLGAIDTETCVALYLRHFSIVREHRPGMVAAPLYIWWADGDAVSKPWQAHARTRLTERIVGGTHFSIMTSPHINLIANDIAAASARTRAVPHEAMTE